MERKGDRCSRHKLAPIVDGPYPVTKVDTEDTSLIIKRPYHTVENSSPNCFVLAPNTKTKTDLLAEAQPMKLVEVVSDYVVNEGDNLRHI